DAGGTQSPDSRLYDLLFCGGAFGSLLSGYAYSHYGWDGVCCSGAAVSALGLVIWLAWKKYDVPQSDDAPARQQTSHT
ncbi:hypothetical protein UA45_21150, partial [Morganella morganii]